MRKWASRRSKTPMPSGVAPLTSLAHSQAERFGIAVTPFGTPSVTKPVQRVAAALDAEVYPSFAYKVHESARHKRTARLFDARLGVMAYNRKDRGYEVAARADVPVPEVYGQLDRIEDVDWATLPDRVVVKPVDGAASRGVFLLERQGDGRWHDHLTSETVRPDDVVSQIVKLVEAKKVGRTIILEELLLPHPDIAGTIAVPDDLKVFTFYDHPAVIMQRRCFGTHDLSKARFRFWDAAWNDLGPVKYADRLDPTMAAPTLRDEVIDAAARLGRELAAPFARIDVYETSRGVVFGEITPHPGPLAGWREDLDRLLGYEWEIAEARLFAEGKRLFDPA